MPVYVYRNLTTGETFEIEQRITEPALTEHPETGDPVKRLIQPVGIAFKGSGFYVTDSRGGNGKAGSGANASGDGPGKDAPSGSSSKDTASKDTASKDSSSKDPSSNAASSKTVSSKTATND